MRQNQDIFPWYNWSMNISFFVPDYILFAIPIGVFVATQLIKFARLAYKYQNIDWRYLLSPGHMPSAHSAMVTALVIVVGFYDAVTSIAFVIATAFAFIVINDAMRIRREIGIQAKYLNILIKEHNLSKEEFPRLKEHIGHFGKEVLGGIGVGIILTFLVIFILENFF